MGWRETGKVNLFTRPRRFGKTLNMSMFRYFFETGTDRTLFDGLEISGDTALCGNYMGKYPVIFLSLKGANADVFETAKGMLRQIVRTEADRLRNRMDINRLSEYQREALASLLDRNMNDETLMNSLQLLSAILSQYYEEKVVVLIDEYDVPLDKAFQYGYYDQMILLIRNFLGQALKTNENLKFAVLTGCLRIAKESIFTGLNNFNVFSITDVYSDEYFGFTDQEVRRLLEDYGLDEHYGETKEWYDGYRFGKAEVYCPWDVINHCRALRMDPEAEPQEYWANTSGNVIVKRLLQRATRQTRSEIEQLIAGEAVEKTIRQELTYHELDNNIENIWSVLFTTGYLTLQGKMRGHVARLVIPNREIRELFVTQIKEWFKEEVSGDRSSLHAFCEAFQKECPEEIQERFTSYLMKTISIRDTFAKRERKESFYHGVLLGLLSSEEEWLIQSNTETGEGYSDILIEIEEKRIGIIIEVKYAKQDALEAACAKAVQQIRERDYAEKLRRDGMKRILAYGIACYRKHCQVMCEEL